MFVALLLNVEIEFDRSIQGSTEIKMDTEAQRLRELLKNSREMRNRLVHGARNSGYLDLVFKIAEEHGIAINHEILWEAVDVDQAEYLCPPVIANFIVSLLRGREMGRLFNPWLSCGTLLFPIIRDANPTEVVGFNPRESVVSNTQRLMVAESNVVLRVHNLGTTEANGLGEFDVVVCAPPFNMRPRSKFTINGVEFRDDTEKAILGRALSMLGDGGVGMFVVTESFWFQKPSLTLREGLKHLGICVDAAFLFRGGIFKRTAIPACLLVVRKGKEKGPTFCAEFQNEPRRRKALLANFDKRREGNDPQLGRFARFEDISSLSSVFAKAELEKKIKRLGLPKHSLSDLTTEILKCPTKREKVEDKPNGFFLPRIVSSPIKLSVDQLPTNPSDYIHIVVDPEKASPVVVAHYFDSPIGKEIRSALSVGATVQRIPAKEIGELSVFLPELSHQKEALEIHQKIDELTDELAILKTDLWRRMGETSEISRQLRNVNKEDTLTDWIATLPFPLASILWTYTTVTEPNRRVNQLDYFFEGLVEFLAVLLLSGAKKNEMFFEEQKKSISALLDKSHLPLSRASQGTWLTIYEHLAKQLRVGLENTSTEQGRANVLRWQRCFGMPLGGLLSDLCSKKIVRVLKKANELRNTWRGHGGIASDQVLQEREQILRGLLNDFKKVVGLKWDEYLLVIPRSSRYRNGEYRYDVSVAKGMTYPFPTQKLILNEPLTDGSLSFTNNDNAFCCPLIPLVRLGRTPEKESNACYFYSSIDVDKVRFISYHYEETSELVEPFDDAMEFISDFTS